MPRPPEEVTLTPDQLERARELAEPYLRPFIPPRERGLLGETVSGIARGAIPGTVEAVGQAFQQVGMPGGETLRGAAKSITESWPGLFEPGTGADRWIPQAAESVAKSLGVSAPAILIGMASGGTGLIPLVAAHAIGSGTVLGLASGRQFYEAAKRAGASEAIASDLSWKAALAEGVPEAAGDLLGGWLIGKGITGPAARSLAKRITGELGKDLSVQAAMKPLLRA